MSIAVPTSTEEKAMALLGQGVAAEQVASTCGVTPSFISQLLSQPEFLSKVTELRYQNLSKHNARDSRYDTIEDKLLDQLENSMAMMYKPLEIAHVLSKVNAAKRRGTSAPEAITNTQTVLNLTIPTQVIQHFTKDVNNMVIKAGSQELITVQSGNMKGLLDARKAAKGEVNGEVKELPAPGKVGK